MKRMLFNATQQEELRVAIVDGQKLIDIDIESAGREQRKGNIYKGIITRVEPSLDACFVNYGEERHGFLPFKEVTKSLLINQQDTSSSKMQDVLKEGMELICQVEKEERGNKGAALTTLISLAGRYLVLMPNNPRGGGVSRRIEGEERQELRETISNLALPIGMSVIVRTAGIGRTLEELQWDLNYLLQLWHAIENASAKQAPPLLIYLESSLVIRAIRDYFQPDVSEILIDTPHIYEQAKTFMGMVMPDNLIKVKYYTDNIPLFSRFQIEHQIESAYARTVTLPSGGAIVLDSTEALVSIDVNSARATRGADIEETALRTNLEAVDEAARQMRLRDLGGLIVIDFIDMDSPKCQREVEQRLKEALHMDRARVQMGKISRFGLMELSRQRLRPALSEGSRIACPRCSGTGHIRDVESSSLQLLRSMQEESVKDNTSIIHVQAPVEVCTYLINEKRTDVIDIEARFGIKLLLIPNRHLAPPNYKLERIREDSQQVEDPKPSYKLAEEATLVHEDSMDRIRRDSEIRHRPQAAVKGITPEQPAPSRLQQKLQNKESIQKMSSFSKVKKWIKHLSSWITKTKIDKPSTNQFQQKKQNDTSQFIQQNNNQINDLRKNRPNGKKENSLETTGKRNRNDTSRLEINQVKRMVSRSDPKGRNRADIKMNLPERSESFLKNDPDYKNENLVKRKDSLNQGNGNFSLLIEPSIEHNIPEPINALKMSNKQAFIDKDGSTEKNEQASDRHTITKRHKRDKRTSRREIDPSIKLEKTNHPETSDSNLKENNKECNNLQDNTNYSEQLSKVTNPIEENRKLNHDSIEKNYTNQPDERKPRRRTKRTARRDLQNDPHLQTLTEKNSQENKLLDEKLSIDHANEKIDYSSEKEKKNIDEGESIFTAPKEVKRNILVSPITETNQTKILSPIVEEQNRNKVMEKSLTCVSVNGDLQTKNTSLKEIKLNLKSDHELEDENLQKINSDKEESRKIRKKTTLSSNNTTHLVMVQTSQEKRQTSIVLDTFNPILGRKNVNKKRTLGRKKQILDAAMIQIHSAAEYAKMKEENNIVI